ncbi:MAG TPA: polysaccharide biosynthesis protein, partial [Myxococcales bacterium]|nr:polysaccharide biosynthesis protein [Myxococcales bacterium]
MRRLTRASVIRGLVMSHDLVMTALAWVLSFLLRYDFSPPATLPTLLAWSTPVAVVVFGVSYRWAQMYGGIWRYASIPDMIRIVRAVVVGTFLMLAILFLTVRVEDMPRSVLIIFPLLLMVFLGFGRLVNRFFKLRGKFSLTTDTSRRPILMIGAGDAAEALLRDSLRPGITFRVVGLLDDNVQKHGLRIHGVEVLGTIDSLAEVMDRLDRAGAMPEEVVIAIPSAPSSIIRHIVQVCERSNLPCRTMPSLEDIVVGRVSVNDLREVTIDDILGRARIRLDERAIRELIHGRRVLITGAGGSIGSELCRQISRFGPEQLILYEQSEFNLYEIDRELARVFPDVECHAVLGDTRSRSRVAWTIEKYKPQIVLHAAAYKHVPLLELNITEGIQNNILGTRTVAKACVEAHVDTFVMVSTDKAVNPTNVMGATKRLAEIYCQNLQALGSTNFIAVRFGNVLGSVGSVVPLFREQIRSGGPVTVTHPDMKRYFMTIPEASQLVLQAATLGAGGELFVLDMGQPVKIVDLARDMIRLSGREESEIEITFTGLRPGE